MSVTTQNDSLVLLLGFGRKSVVWNLWCFVVGCLKNLGC